MPRRLTPLEMAFAAAVFAGAALTLVGVVGVVRAATFPTGYAQVVATSSGGGRWTTTVLIGARP